MTIKPNSGIWVSMKDIGSGMGVKIISDLISKEIYMVFVKQKFLKEKTS